MRRPGRQLPGLFRAAHWALSAHTGGRSEYTSVTVGLYMGFVLPGAEAQDKLLIWKVGIIPAAT